MNQEQIKAANNLRNALKKAGISGLQGGVFDSKFCVWPCKRDDQVHAAGLNFFEEIENVGGIVMNIREINLDGGAGV